MGFLNCCNKFDFLKIKDNVKIGFPLVVITSIQWFLTQKM